MAEQRIALVTGGTGFTGSNLIKRLIADDWQVHAIVRAGSNFSLLETCLDQISLHIHDGSTEKMVKIVALVKPDVVFHLAALFLAQHAPEDIVSLVKNNITFSTQLVEAMAENGVNRLVNTGTSWQHHQNSEYSPTCLYAATKQAFEAILQYYIDVKSFKIITLKLFDSYGPDDPRPKLFSLLKKASTSAQPLLMSPGEQLIDLVHIDDVVEAFIIAADRLLDGLADRHEKYAVSSGEPISLQNLVSIYEQENAITLPVQWGGRAYRDREVMTPWNIGKSLPGWQAKIKLKNGLKR